MGLFSKKTEYCAVCNKELVHKHKPKREWDVKGKLCANCHLDKSKEFYEAKIRQPCKICSTTQKISELWEPRWQWDMNGLLCKQCFDNKESEHTAKKNFCTMCNGKMGLIRYNAKPKWKIQGQLCRTCWDEQKSKHG